MKNRKKILGAAAVILSLVLILVFCVCFYYREQSFSEILPEVPESEPEMVQIMKQDADSAAPMSGELFRDFIREMDQFQYRHVTDAFGMDSFGRIIYRSNGADVEIMFSSERGGSVLVNPMDREGDEPVYQIVGGSASLEKIFDSYAEKAQRQQPEKAE